MENVHTDVRVERVNLKCKICRKLILCNNVNLSDHQKKYVSTSSLMENTRSDKVLKVGTCGSWRFRSSMSVDKIQS